MTENIIGQRESRQVEQAIKLEQQHLESNRSEAAGRWPIDSDLCCWQGISSIRRICLLDGD